MDFAGELEMGKNFEKELFQVQVGGLEEKHFLVLYWAAIAEDRHVCYNITNCFDDLKALEITRTKQTATAVVEVLQALRFVDIREEGNRKNIYITSYGAKALENLILNNAYAAKKSLYLEE